MNDVVGVGISSGGGEDEWEGRESSSKGIVGFACVQTGEGGFFLVGVFVVVVIVWIGGCCGGCCGCRWRSWNGRWSDEGGVEYGAVDSESGGLHYGGGVTEYFVGVFGFCVDAGEEIEYVVGGEAGWERHDVRFVVFSNNYLVVKKENIQTQFFDDMAWCTFL